MFLSRGSFWYGQRTGSDGSLKHALRGDLRAMIQHTYIMMLV
jgi:hypothetical protein